MKKLFLLSFLAIAFCLSVFAQMPTIREMMREPAMAGMRPDSERLSPDGKFVIFAWNAQGKEPKNLYIVNSNGTNPRIAVNAEETYENREERFESKLNYGLNVRDEFAKAREKNLGGVDISPDSNRILFSQNSDIYVLELTGANAKPRRITRTLGFEGAARWLTNDAIMYSSGGNFFVLNIRETSLVQITKEANPQAFQSIFNVTPTKNGMMAAYVVSDGSKQRALFVPNYLDEFVQTPSVRRGFTDQKLYVTKTDGSFEKPLEIKLPKAEGVGYLRGVSWAADEKTLIVDRIDMDLKRRRMFYVRNIGEKNEEAILVTDETDAKWFGGRSSAGEPNPKNPVQLFFTSERDGFSHLYLAIFNEQAKNFSVTQLTRGNWEVDWAKWTADGRRIVYTSTEEGTAEREFFALNIDDGTKSKIGTAQKGMRNSPQIDEENAEPVLLYRFSKWNAPTELFTAKVCRNCTSTQAKQLTKSAPQEFLNRKWNEPKFIDIPSRDGKLVKSKIYLPSNFNKSRKYPMVIFVHGAGYLQNTINGWNNYYREFMFNQLLTEKGYVVLDIDFRGSAGYGRDWRTDVFDFLGGKDYEDHLDAIDYAVKNYAVNPQKVGAYGGSYGGFMAGMLVMRAPEKIAAAAALRPVFDWKNYFAASPIYTAERLGMPDKNPEAYKRSSPIAYADKLQKPLLILHGLVDDNVHAQDSIQLIEKLMRLDKTDYFDAMLYPSENHGFQRPSSWTDEYIRIFNFFEKHLK